jgi:hypothetical protein
MYNKAKKILGFWTILLESEHNNPKAIPQFKSLSRKAANVWRDLNEPAPAAYQLNATAGATVWRNRGQA